MRDRNSNPHEAGDVLLTPAETHAVRNVGEEPFLVVVV
jgi:quercetin dioxygenase-like cupin family protein